MPTKVMNSKTADLGSPHSEVSLGWKFSDRRDFLLNIHCEVLNFSYSIFFGILTSTSNQQSIWTRKNGSCCPKQPSPLYLSPSTFLKTRVSKRRDPLEKWMKTGKQNLHCNSYWGLKGKWTKWNLNPAQFMEEVASPIAIRHPQCWTSWPWSSAPCRWYNYIWLATLFLMHSIVSFSDCH